MRIRERIEEGFVEGCLFVTVKTIEALTRRTGAKGQLSRDIQEFARDAQGRSFPHGYPGMTLLRPDWDLLPEPISVALQTSLKSDPSASLDVSVVMSPGLESLDIQTRTTRPGINTWLVAVSARDYSFHGGGFRIFLKENEHETQPTAVVEAIRQFVDQFENPIIYHNPTAPELHLKTARSMLNFAQSAGCHTE